MGRGSTHRDPVPPACATLSPAKCVLTCLALPPCLPVPLPHPCREIAYQRPEFEKGQARLDRVGGRALQGLWLGLRLWLAGLHWPLSPLRPAQPPACAGSPDCTCRPPAVQPACQPACSPP